jgi:hypothetical protein
VVIDSDLGQSGADSDPLASGQLVAVVRMGEVGVDHIHLRTRPTETGSLVRKGILAGGRLGVVADLRHQRDWWM